MSHVCYLFCYAALACIAAEAADTPTLRLPLRTRVEAFKGSGDWQEVHFEKSVPISRCAIVICDMWDKHWCTGASRRVDALAGRMAPVIEAARAAGVQIIHAPSETMDFYKSAPERLRIIAFPKVDPPPSLRITDPPLPIDDANGGCDTPDKFFKAWSRENSALRIAPERLRIIAFPKVDPPPSVRLTDPPLPIDDANGGCDTPDKFFKAWSRENSALRIAPEDVVSDNGAEIYSFLRARGIDHLLVMGVHTNMCVLNRTFAIKQMTNWGERCILVRDLTDSMYNPEDRPYVPHDQGTELVIQHIEKYWAPTVLAPELLRAASESK